MNASCLNLQPAPKIALLACSVFEPEIARLTRGAEHFAETRWFEMDLHDRPDQLRAILQEQLDEVDARNDIDAIVLADGPCGRTTLVEMKFLRSHMEVVELNLAPDFEDRYIDQRLLP